MNFCFNGLETISIGVLAVAFCGWHFTGSMESYYHSPRR